MHGQTPRGSAARRLVFACVGLLVLTLITLHIPGRSLADTDLVVGGSARVAYADGDDVRLRDSPSYDATILTTVPEGTTVDVLDGPLEADDGSLWYQIAVEGETGYMVSDYLAAGDAPAGDDGGDDAGDVPTGDTAVTTDNLNLRAAPSMDADVLDVMPAGATVELTGDAEDGFYPVSYRGQSGWASGDYLDIGSDSGDDGSGDLPGGDDGGGGSGIVWPFESGTTWEITQGYNGPYSHQNEGSLYQYYYSFDLALVDGDSTGQSVLSPVKGTIRWIDESTGGMSIDLGDGYAAAFFHTYLADGLAAGQSVAQGQFLGTVAAAGDAANAGFPHLHLTLWATDDGGNWSRTAVPFTGAHAISGQDFPDLGDVSNQYAGTVVYP